MNRPLIVAAAVAAFTATWFQPEESATTAVHGRPESRSTVALASEWPGPEPIEAPVAASGNRTVDELLLELDSDLGEDGAPVDRERIEHALRSDPELRRALGLP